MTEKICPDCGKKFSEYSRSGMLGCPSCYRAFKEELLPVISKCQNGTVHVGKSPRITGADKELVKEYQRLLNEYKTANAVSDFNKMAAVRSEIKAIESALRERGII